MKILILALSGIGDALMFTPALKLLRQSLPSAEIDALVMFKGTKEIYETNTNFNKIIHFDLIKEGTLNSLKFVLGLRNKYDATINIYPSNRKEYNKIADKRALGKILAAAKIGLKDINKDAVIKESENTLFNSYIKEEAAFIEDVL